MKQELKNLKNKKEANIFNLKESHRDHIVCSLASSYAHFKESDSQKWFITILKTAPFFKRWFIIKNQTLKDRFKFYKKSKIKAKSLVPGLKSFYYGQINLLKNSNQYFLLKGKNGVFLLGKLAELAGSYSYGTFNRLVNIDFANLYLSKNDFFILLNQLLKQKPEIEIAIIEKKSFPYWPYKSYFIENILVLKDEKWD